MAKRKKSGGQKTAEKAKTVASRKLNTYAKLAKSQPKGLNKAQKAKQKDLKETVRTAKRYIAAAKTARDMSYEDLQEARSEEMTQRGLLSGQKKFDEGLQARAYGDYMRQLTGRQKGQGTPYTGPGATVVQDDEGNIVRGPQGRVQYQIDPEAYAKRFIPQFKPTEEQLGMDLNIQEGLLTPWQQTNFQWLLGEEGLSPTAEGRIPGAFRQDWRKEQWGDVYDDKTGLWTRAEDPQQRATAVSEQLRRYNAGEFNPTVGSVAGDRWTGKGVGVASADQWLPEGWTPPGGPGAGPGPGAGGGEYTPMAAQDWSGIMPQGVFAGSAVQPTQAMQGLVADQGLQYQPWAMPDNSVAGSPFVSQNVQYNAPLNYNPVVANQDNLNNQNNQQLNTQAWVGPDGETDFNAWSLAQHDAMYPGRRAAAMEAGFGGLNYFAPGAAEWRASLVNGQIPQADAGEQALPWNVPGK